MVGREGSKSASWMRSIKEVELASRYAEPSDLAYLNGILVASTIVVIAESEINYRLRTGDDLPDGREVIVVGIRHFCLRGIGRATGQERLARGREALKSTVMSSSPACPPEED